MRISDWSSDVCSSDLAQECLRAVVEQLVDLNDHGEQRPLVLDDQVVEEFGVTDQRGPPVDPQGVAATGDVEVKPDVRVAGQVLVAVGTAVPGSPRDQIGQASCR